jgi:hypothetical protein
MKKKLLIICSSVLLFLLFFLFLAKGSISAHWLIDSRGNLIYETIGQILGRKTDNPSENKGPTAEPPGQTIKITVQEKIQEKTKAREEQNLAIIERDGLKIKIRTRTETTEGLETSETPETSESAELEIEEPESKRNVKVRSAGNAFMVIRDKVAAKTNFPLMVNLETNELIVTTPKGSKVVTILPDQAVKNMLAANVLDQLGGKGGLRWLEYQEQLKAGEATEAGEENEEATEAGETPDEPGEGTEEAALAITTPVEEVISLITTDDGTLAYEIPGIKYEKFMGMIKVKLQRTAIVSAETGELLRIEQEFLTRILDFFSI